MIPNEDINIVKQAKGKGWSGTAILAKDACNNREAVKLTIF